VVLAGLAARPGQGASAAIANLAIALAQAGQRVVLIDGDLRNPSLHDWFELPAGPGLAALAADAEDAARLAVATPVANLSLVSASEGVANPWAVLRSPRVAAFLAALRQAADFVLINTPPASAGADALALAGQADAALLVFRLRAIPGAPEAALRAALRSAALPVLGMVLNDARAADLRSLELPSAARPRPAEVAGPASSYAG
jgi:capsular exopolysaccharide synthesis family protein